MLRLGVNATAKKLGVARRAVQYYEERGIIKRGGDGKFDFDEVKNAIMENINPGHQPDSLTELRADFDGEGNKNTYMQAKTAREVYEAKIAALKFGEMDGSLVQKSVVEKILFERARQFRDGVAATSKRIAPLVVGKESLKEIELLLDSELTYMLDQFSKLPVIE